MPRAEYAGRRAEIYFPSPERLQAWKDAAKIAGRSLSAYIIEMAENGRKED